MRHESQNRNGNRDLRGGYERVAVSGLVIIIVGVLRPALTEVVIRVSLVNQAVRLQQCVR